MVKNTGSNKWNFNTNGEAGTSGIILEDDCIYLSVSKGYVYKLNEKNEG